jgi:NAD(P)-dependent dehydrogenase (short-subunit alcohol dehydrogenase family)
MELAGKHAVVTGAAGGIGSALAARFAEEGAKAVVVADFDLEGARRVAEDIGGLPIQFDASSPESVRSLIQQATDANGTIDVFVSNAGVPGPNGGPEAPDHEWDATWRINVMSHVWAARELVPQMAERGDGYIVSTASAAGLLTQVSAAAYSVTKHAAVALAEWMSVNYGDQGIKFSCICPQGVQTAMLDLAMDEPAGAAALRAGGIIQPEDVAEAVVQGMREERFLILPHAEVADHMALKGSNPDRWLGGMRKIVRQARS